MQHFFTLKSRIILLLHNTKEKKILLTKVKWNLVEYWIFSILGGHALRAHCPPLQGEASAKCVLGRSRGGRKRPKLHAYLRYGPKEKGEDEYNLHNALAFSKNYISTLLFGVTQTSQKKRPLKLLQLYTFILVCCDLSWLAIHFISFASNVLVLLGLPLKLIII